MHQTEKKCDGCGLIQPSNYNWMTDRIWWTFFNYYGLTGYFCPDCYQKLNHGTDNKPKDAKFYSTVAVKQRLQRANNV